MNEQISELRGALARGYCTKENEHKVLDAVLIEAMAQEVLKAFPQITKKPIKVSLMPDSYSGGTMRYLYLNGLASCMPFSDSDVRQAWIDSHYCEVLE